MTRAAAAIPRAGAPLALVILVVVVPLATGCGKDGDKNRAACNAMQRVADLSDRYVRTPVAERPKLDRQARAAADRLLKASRDATARNLVAQGQELARFYLRQLDRQPVEQQDLTALAQAVDAECQRLGRRVVTPPG